MFFDLHLIWWPTISLPPIIDEVHFDPLNKVVAAACFHFKVTLSLLKTNTYLGN